MLLFLNNNNSLDKLYANQTHENGCLSFPLLMFCHDAILVSSASGGRADSMEPKVDHPRGYFRSLTCQILLHHSIHHNQKPHVARKLQTRTSVIAD